MRPAAAATGVVATAALAVIAPLWVYSLTLALFGLPHVLVELRYVDERFGARLGARTVALLAVLLLGVALVRVSGLGGLGTTGDRAMIELLIGVGLAAVVVPPVARRSPPAAGCALGVCVAVAAGAVEAPAVTLVVLALLHNLTPVGFVAERLRGAARRRALLACALVFGVVPVLLGTGVASGLLAWSGPTVEGPPGIGSLTHHLGAFVPAPLLDDPIALDLFRAAAFLQCMHYAMVLHVLPRLGGGGEEPGARWSWPARSAFRVAILTLEVAILAGFAASFGEARALYGVFAAVHAWVEIPILLAALALPPARDGLVEAS